LRRARRAASRSSAITSRPFRKTLIEAEFFRALAGRAGLYTGGRPGKGRDGKFKLGRRRPGCCFDEIGPDMKLALRSKLRGCSRKQEGRTAGQQTTVQRHRCEDHRATQARTLPEMTRAGSFGAGPVLPG